MPGNVFDQFDTPQRAPNIYDQFDRGYQPPPEQGDFVRGAKVAFGQTVPILKGVVGLAGATAENVFGEGGFSTGVKNWGLKGYQEGMQKLAPLQKDTDELTTAWDKAKHGDLGALVDWAQYGLGYAAGQGGEALITSLIGGVAGAVAAPEAAPITAPAGAITGLLAKGAAKEAAVSLIEKAVVKEANRLMAESGGKLAAEQATKEATKSIAKNIGSTSALLAYGTGQELGSIYPEAEAEAAKKGEKLSGGDLARIWGTGLVAGGIEGLTDRLGVEAAFGKVKIPGVNGRLANAVLQGVGGAGVEGATEGLQTVIERYGAGQEIGSDEGIKDIINSTGLGAIGGGGIGAGAGLLHGRQQAEPPAPAQPTEPPLQIGNTPDPFIVFPDGTTGKRSELEGYINGLPADQQIEARAKLLGMAPQAGTTPEAAAPPAALEFDKGADYLPAAPAPGDLTTSLGAAPERKAAPGTIDFEPAAAIMGAGSVDDAIKLAEMATKPKELPDLPGGRTLEKDLDFMRADADRARGRESDLDRITQQAAEQDIINAALARAAAVPALTPMQLALQRAREAKAATQAPSIVAPEPVAPVEPIKPEPRLVPANGLFLMTRKGAERRAAQTGGELVQAMRSNGQIGFAVLPPGASQLQPVTANEQDQAALVRGNEAQAQPQAQAAAETATPEAGAAGANIGPAAGAGLQTPGIANAGREPGGNAGAGVADLGASGGTGVLAQGTREPTAARAPVRDADSGVVAGDDGRGGNGALTELDDDDLPAFRSYADMTPAEQAAWDAKRGITPEMRAENAAKLNAMAAQSADLRRAAEARGDTRSLAAMGPSIFPPRIIARVGRTPNSAQPIELRPNKDGTSTPYLEGEAMLDFDSGEPIKLEAHLTDDEAKAAIRKAGAVSNKQNFYAPKDVKLDAVDEGTEPAQNQEHEPDPEGQRDADKFAERLRGAGYGTAVLTAVRPGTESQRAASALAKRIFGQRVVWVEFNGKPIFNGARFGDTPGVIYLWAGSERPAMAVIGHELLHTLRNDSPAIYQDLLSRLRPQLQNEEGHRRALAEKNPRAAQDADVVTEELLADIVGDHFTEPEFWAELGNGKPEGFRAIVDAVIKFLNKIITRVTLLRPYGSETYLRDLKQSREAVAAALSAYSESRPAASKTGGDFQFSRDTTRSVPAFNNASGNFNPDLDPYWLKQGAKEISGERMSDADHNTAVAEYANAWRVDELLQKLGWTRRGSSNVSSSAYYVKDVEVAPYEDDYGNESTEKRFEIRVSDHEDRHPNTDPEVAQRLNVNFRDGSAQWSDADIGPGLSTAEALARLESIATNEQSSPDSPGVDSNADIRFDAIDAEKPAVRAVNATLEAADALQRIIGAEPKAVGQTARRYSAAQRAAMDRVGFGAKPPTASERLKVVWQDAGKKLAQGLADQFAPVKELSAEAYGLLRLSKGASGAFEAMLKGGKLKLTDGVYDFDETQRGGVIDRLLMPLGGEHHDFFRWVAANRAEKLAAEGRENLFTADDIAALKTLRDGVTDFDFTLQHGIRKGQTTRDRTLIYPDALKTFNEFQNNVLDMAEQSGLIDGEARKLWQSEFYVPFYRVTEDSGVASMNIKGGVVRQQAFKQLKGGKDKLNADLLDNTLMNWAHLLDAAAKNRAAKATLEAAEKMGVAIPAGESVARELASSIGRKDGVVWFMDKGDKRFYLVDDPYLLTAINALEYAGMRGPVMDAMSKVKHVLTVGVTASPFFKVRNLIRDSVQVIGTSGISTNAAKNIGEGWKATNPKSDEWFRLLAGGGTIHFGTMYEGAESKRVQQLVEAGVDKSAILDSPGKLKAFYKKVVKPSIDAYNELGNRGEAINRASLYKQLKAQGMSHAEASLQARDLMDFSLQGSFSSIRFLSQVVPFLNARIQGLYKLGRAAKEDPARFTAVVGAATLASLALLMAYGDDEEWKKREDWDRDNYWWFKVGGTAFRIPKPFEVGAIGTLAERSFEYAFDKEMDGKRFRERVLALLGSNLSMNPIPQLVKPALDVYANVDSFTDRPIESQAMQKLKSEYRFNNSTSMAARAISTAANKVTGIIGKEALSPVQVDQLLRGYFGWLGSFIVSAGDILARPTTGQPDRATPDYWKAATGGMVANLEDAPSRYVSHMYTQAKEIEEAYATWKSLLKAGKVEEAKEFREDNADALRKYRAVEQIKKRESQLSARIKQVEESDQDSDTKRAVIRQLKALQDSTARTLARLN